MSPLRRLLMVVAATTVVAAVVVAGLWMSGVRLAGLGPEATQSPAAPPPGR
jgi:hypothetical protein